MKEGACMTTEEKMQHLLDTTMINARKQAYDIIKEYHASADQIYLEYKKTKQYEADSRIKAEKTKYEREINKEMFSEQLVIRKELSDKKQELEDKLFAEILEMLAEYRKTEEYDKQLIAQIEYEKNFAGEEGIIIYLDPLDADKKEKLENITNCTLTISSYSFLGGTRAITNGKKILIDQSFQTRMEEEKEKFVFRGGRKNGK